MCETLYLNIARTAQITSVIAQGIGQDEFDALYRDILTGRVLMGRDNKGLESARFLLAADGFGEHNGQCNLLAGADIAQGHAQLNDRAL